MTETMKSPTRSLFESLAKLYKQGQLLLLDSDRLMEERGWTPMHSNAIAELSNSKNAPQRWFARWAMRFYRPTMTEEESMTDQLLFISIHFASDHDTDVDKPVVSAGRLLYDKAMNKETADTSYEYWMCKSCFYGEPHETLQDWQCWDRPGYIKNLKRIETFRVWLYDITSSRKLKELVISPLLAVQEKERGVT